MGVDVGVWVGVNRQTYFATFLFEPMYIITGSSQAMIHTMLLKSLSAKFLRGNFNIYFHFVIAPYWHDTNS